ncbi:sodium- and chloride-dependent betaine transporter-like isoform X2 [Hippoglossus hippoglossus]|uniref:sodium- and chloride-dependent betaine transporter-like isoform X2 n=1 Tax=Hippoglossus hippoglossus TaxID=8267 RepID=UPI00148D0D56|nr:sodium- and chloride-dependent betaine transporter-like isoform X2 [Hippoglossus hippoglossus]
MDEEKAGGPSAAGVGPDEGPREEGTPPRGKWANNKEFLLAMTGGIIGVGNFWLFPFSCYRHGGAAFLIPYFLFLLFIGGPLFLLETALGQYTNEGAVTAWRKICPMFEGVGMASQVTTFYLNTYFIVVLAWNIFYLIYSFKSPLPWSTCDNSWNSELCHSPLNMIDNPHQFYPNTSWSFLDNISLPDDFESISYINLTDLSQLDNTLEEEFWRNRVLRMSDKLLGKVHWDLALCLLLAWVICYFCTWKGIKSIGKVVYFTATVPYLLLLILFFRAVTLPGAGQGLYYYLFPDLRRLADPFAWEAAAMCVMYTYAMSQGVLTTLGSYNKYNRNCYRDCMALCCLSCVTSIFAGFIVFSVLGFLAHVQGVDLNDVAFIGPSLIFKAFPLALSVLPVSTFWTVLFFLTVFLLGVDSHIMFMESLATAITDMFPRHLRRPGAREVLVLVIAVVCFLLGLTFITEGGIIPFQIVDGFGANGSILLVISCLETVIIGWVYGADRFYDNIEDMIGYRPNPVIKYCWMFITPLISVLLLLLRLLTQFSSFEYGYQLEPVASIVGALLLTTPLMCIPVFIFVALWRNPQNMTSPSSDLRQARPHKPVLTLCKRVIFKAQGPAVGTTAETHEKIMMEEPSGV